MNGHLLLFGTEIGKPAAAITGGVGELRFPPTDRFPGALLTYRDLAGVDDLIAAAVELRAMLGDAQAHDDGWAGGQVRAEESARSPINAPAHEAPAPPDDVEPCTCIEGNDVAIVTTSVEGCPQHGCGDLDELPQRIPEGPPPEPEPWNDDDDPVRGRTTYPQLSEEALAAEVPLVSLAPEPQEDEAQE